jgi:hypothetical protein
MSGYYLAIRTSISALAITWFRASISSGSHVTGALPLSTVTPGSPA